ncbi:MAG: hypothetical protein V4850_04450 [Myxococcota bacterium]
MAVDRACEAMEAEDELRTAIVDSVMTPEKQKQTAKGMDTEDGVTLAVGVGVEAGAKTPVGNAKGSADLEYATTISNTVRDDDVEVSTRTSLTFKGELELKKLEMKTTPGLTFVFEGGQLSQWYFSLSGAKELTLTKLNQLVLVGADWGQDLVNGMANMIAMAGKQEQSVAQATSLLSSIAVGPEALKYTVFGTSLREAATHPSFAGQSAMAVELCLGGQVGWSAAKGLEIKASVGTGTSWSLGTEGVTPLFIAAKSGDTIVSFSYDSVDGLAPT